METQNRMSAREIVWEFLGLLFFLAKYLLGVMYFIIVFVIFGEYLEETYGAAAAWGLFLFHGAVVLGWAIKKWGAKETILTGLGYSAAIVGCTIAVIPLLAIIDLFAGGKLGLAPIGETILMVVFGAVYALYAIAVSGPVMWIAAAFGVVFLGMLGNYWAMVLFENRRRRS